MRNLSWSGQHQAADEGYRVELHGAGGQEEAPGLYPHSQVPPLSTHQPPLAATKYTSESMTLILTNRVISPLVTLIVGFDLKL